MSWELKSDRAVYLQLIEHIQRLIISGVYNPGDKLPSVRDLAAEAEVNPNTMQKALVELERGGLIYTNRTTGKYITEDKNMIQVMKQHLAKDQLKVFLENMSLLGFNKEETLSFILKESEGLT